jgi:hypothetical protein
MGDDARWTAAAIAMDGSSKIVMDSKSSDGQRWRNGWQDSKMNAMGNGTAVVQWTAQWAAKNHHRCRSGAMGGNVRWMVVAITMDSDGMIALDGGRGNGQRRRNGQRDGKAIAMDNGTTAL